MVIRMYFALRPSRRIEAFALERKQLGLLLHFEYLQGHAPGGSVDATAGDFATPHQSATRYVVEIDELLPLKKRSRVYATLFSTTGLSWGWRGRAGSGRKPR